MYYLLPGVAAAALVLPGAAVQVADAPLPRPKKHIPTGFLVLESEHNLWRCPGLAPTSGTAGVPHAASKGKSRLPSITSLVKHVFRGRPADFSGTWLLQEMSGDVDKVLEASGLAHSQVPTVRSLGYGAGSIMERIHQQGARFSVRTSFKGAPNEEVVTYDIGKPPSAANANETTRCASWADDKKNEILLQTPPSEGMMPVMLHRYMEGPIMVTRLTSGNFEAKGFWHPSGARAQTVEKPNAKLQEAIATLHKADRQSHLARRVQQRVHGFFHPFSGSKGGKK